VGAGFEGDLEPFDAPWDSRHCRILDPDGNAIDLFAPPPLTPSSRAVEDSLRCDSDTGLNQCTREV
jgi:hypothetical protein